MSNLIHCDGPDCDKTKDREHQLQLCEAPWIKVDQGEMMPRLDFHSRACLTAWSTGDAATPTADDRPCTCHRAEAEPHTKAEHQAYPTVVDGL